MERTGETVNIPYASKEELLNRINKLHAELNKKSPGWDAAFVVDRVNMFYLSSTMQDGVFILKNSGDFGLFVRRSYERAKDESPLEDIASNR